MTSKFVQRQLDALGVTDIGKRHNRPKKKHGKGDRGEKIKRELVNQLQLLGVPTPLTEYRFHPTRQWRFDYAWPVEKIALEYEGGIWDEGRHIRGKGYENDCEKYDEATFLGWRVYRCTYDLVASGYIADLIKRHFDRIETSLREQ